MKEHNYDNCHNITCRRRCINDGYNDGFDDGYDKAINDVITVINGILPYDTSTGRYIDRDLLCMKLKRLSN